jgi:hypothetical protein
LQYVLDPQEVYGSDFSGEMFRVLTKSHLPRGEERGEERETKQYGESRTRRLVFEKWDALNGL